MARATTASGIEEIREAAHSLTGAAEDYDLLMERIGDAPFVLLGEATHGTHEFYQARAEITKRLIQEKGFSAVAVEADWPDAYRVNRFVRGLGTDQQSLEALQDFQRFPSWMWRNADVLDFVGWLREHNQHRPNDEKIGFYGLDLYSLYTSIDAVISYLDEVDPEAAQRARQRYTCFDHTADDPVRYGYAVKIGTHPSCEDEVVDQLIELRRKAALYLQRDGVAIEDELFFAEQNAHLVANAELYYRGMFDERVNAWNLRDQHMAQTLNALWLHLKKRRPNPKIVVWEHNSHIGDARATEMKQRDELNIGQLVREQYGDKAVLVGFTTHHGTVSAASEWGGPVERKAVRPALHESYEALFHQTGLDRFQLTFPGASEAGDALRTPRLERAIGVIYRPETERLSHYFQSRLSDQFDVVLHFDETRAVEPLEISALWRKGEEPETYPFGV